jgi:uncharacterized protein (TIGR04442 family)
MIQDIRLHGEISDKIEYYATVAGRDISRRYFHEIGTKSGKPFVRFFSSGNEFKMDDEGVSYNATGGLFCQYMFGIDLPVRDLIKKNVMNRLVMFGGTYSPANDRITFTNDVFGSLKYDHIFFSGHAVNNYFFFIHSDLPATASSRQETILRAIGKYLKHTDKVGEHEDTGLIREIYRELDEEKSIVFLFRIVNRYNEEYYREFDELYTKRNRFLDDDDRNKLEELSKRYDIDRYQVERMKIDLMYKHPVNKRIVDEYKGVLVDCAEKPELGHQDMAKLARLRTLSIRYKIPLNLFDMLDELLLKGKKIKEFQEPEYIRDTRAIFEGLFLRGHPDVKINSEDMMKLLSAKHQAIEHRDNSFEEILLETCRLTDERATLSNDITLLESFGYIVTYFDRYDTTLSTINQIAFMEDVKVNEEKIRSILGNKRAFEEIQPGLFFALFIKSIHRNKYLTTFGRRKTNTLYAGIREIEEGNMTVLDVQDTLSEIIKEERYYSTILSYMKDRIKKFYSDLSDKESQDQFIAEVWKDMLDEKRVGHDCPEKVFRDAVINIRKEAYYLHNLLPVITTTGNARLREDFLQNSGLDRYYVEEIEREYFDKNKLDQSLLDRIRKGERSEEPEQKSAKFNLS